MRTYLLVIGCTSIALSALAMIRGRNEPEVVIGLAVFFLAAWILAGTALGRKKVVRGLLTSMMVFALIVVVPEMALRSWGFRHESGIEFGYPRPEHFTKLVHDERLFWKLEPSREGINSLGFPGDEITPKEAGTFRILYLGDSCSYENATVVPYTRRVQELLSASHEDGPRMEYVSLSIPGYTSHQGRILAEDYGALVDPDLVVVYYGWNDHWLAYGQIDSEKHMQASPEHKLFDPENTSIRLVQAALYLRDEFRGQPSGLLGRPRVPVEQYRDNLVAIMRQFERQGTPTILITAPTSHRLVVPEYLMEMNFVVDRQSAVSIHTEYTDVVRAVAASEGAHLLDLEQDFNAMEPERLKALFLVDGIHFSDAGAQEAAGRLEQFVEGVIRF